MILRRFMRHIKAQNWFAVGLDVIVVIVGIFLGLQVQEWYEERNERTLERIYISRLIDETNANLKIMNQHERIFHDKVQFILDLPDMDLMNAINEDANQFMYRLDFSSYVQIPDFRSETYHELESSGRLLLIRNTALRSELASILNDYQSTRSVFIEPIGEYRKLLFEALSGEQYYQYRVGNGVTDINTIISSVEMFRKSKDFKSAANSEITYGADILFYIRSFQQRLNQLLNLLESEKKKFQ